MFVVCINKSSHSDMIILITDKKGLIKLTKCAAKPRLLLCNMLCRIRSVGDTSNFVFCFQCIALKLPPSAGITK